ncbi:swarming motility protein YbiA [Enterobacter sp. HN503E2II]|nr:swarming motility protein YbiA [Enterobacter sp. HN503E2II]
MMRKALRAKFEQHAELRALLLATAHAKLVEHTENDAYWGDGGNGKGKNRLGYLLMELREQLAIEK